MLYLVSIRVFVAILLSMVILYYGISVLFKRESVVMVVFGGMLVLIAVCFNLFLLKVGWYSAVFR